MVFARNDHSQLDAGPAGMPPPKAAPTADLEGGPIVSVGSIERALDCLGANFQADAAAQTGTDVLRGYHGALRLRRGLYLHFSDAIDLCDMKTRLEQRPGLSIQVFLRGPVNARLGGRPLLPGPIGDTPGRVGPKALLTARAGPELFERSGTAGAHIRKVSVTLSHDWLEDCAPDIDRSAFDVRRFAQTHLAQRVWSPSSDLMALTEGILGLSPFTGAVQRLHLESRVLDLVAQVLSDLTDTRSARDTGRLEPRDLRRMRVIEDYLAASDPADISLEDLAQGAGISVSTLRRLFQAVHGMSAFEYVRRRNLDRARVALEHQRMSVKEAAFLAGYSSPANFSTAFRRQFGYSPGQASRMRP